MNNTSVKTILLSWLLGLVFPVWVYSQTRLEDIYTVFRFKMEDGLPCNYVDDILEDHCGFLWILTSGGGACRFDGRELLVFDSSSVPSLQNNFTRNAVEDRFGRLWIGSEGGLDVLDLETLQKADIALPPLYPDGPVICSQIALDARGNIWLKFGSTLYCLLLDDKGGVSETLSFTDDRLSPINMVFEDVERNGTVWISLKGILHRIVRGRSGVLEAVPIANAPQLGSSTYVSGFLADGPRVWISTEDGLFQFYTTTGEWKHYENQETNPRSLTQNFVTSITQTAEGQLLASTLHGLNVYNPLSDDFDRVGTAVINCIKASGKNILVATEDQGWMALSPKRLDIKDFLHNAENPSSLSSGAVNAVWQDEGGRLWVGCVEGGLNIGEAGEDGFVHLTRERSGLSHNSVSALRPGPDPIMYVGTWGGGTDVVSARPPYRKLYHLDVADGKADYVGMLEYDTRNRLLWVGSNQGIFVFDPSSGSFSPVVDEPCDGSIGSCIDDGGRLWVGGLRGVFVFDLDSRFSGGRFSYSHYLPREKICCVAQGLDGTIYLGSNGSGLFQGTENADGTFSFDVVNTQNGLSNNNVRGICKDLSNHIWIATERGLNRLDPETGIIEAFFCRDGLYNDNFHWNNSWEGTGGKLYFGHAAGLSVLDPAHFSETTEKRQLLFTRILVDDTGYRNPYPRKLDLHEKNRSVNFRFSLLGPGSVNQYQYRLLGMERKWQALPEGQQSVTYSTLPGGKYEFQVRALDSYHNVLGSVSLPIKVRKYFYHTGWYYVLVILAVLYLGWLVVKWRTRILKRRQEELEEVVQERTREISEQKKLVEKNVEELHHQNEILLRQNEELASQKLLFAPERRSESERREDQFREKALETLRQLYKNPDLDVNLFCRSIGISKTLLNNRLQESFGQSIGQLIRTYRLAVAREMLESGTGLTVSEIAYEVGFNDPKYFTRCFTKEFGVTPSSVGK